MTRFNSNKTIALNFGLVSLFFICFCSIFKSCSNDKVDDSEFITLGTFNIAWLGDGKEDINPRNKQDYKNIALLIANTQADILALQEIENEVALKKLTKHLKDFSFFVGEESGKQNPALLFKNNIQVNFIGYIYELEVEKNKTKPGLLFQVKKKNFDWLMAVIHFKSTSRYDSTDVLKQQSRLLRAKQSKALSRWIDSVLAVSSEQDLLILGDFNDYPTRKTQPTLTDLTENTNVEFITSGLKSCKFEYLFSIDHILVSNSAKIRYLNNSLRMYNFYNAFTSTEAEVISDHCPVLATFNITLPDND